MVMKFLNQLQILPWCFHLMRAHHEADEERPLDSIKLIKSDGQVSVYHRPVHVSELLSEFPKHLVCHSDSFYIGQKIPALPEHEQLQPGQKYFLLPSHFFQSVLSFVAIASFVSSQPTAAPLSGVVKKAAAQHQLFDVQRTQSGGLRIRVSDEFISQLMEEGRKKGAATTTADPREDKDGPAREVACGGTNRVCTTVQLERDYQQLVAGSRVRQWKPKLEAIEERSEKKRPGLISKSFGIRRRKKNPQPHHPRPENPTTKILPSPPPLPLPPTSKSRMRMRSRK